MGRQKSLALINDFTGYGRCSVSVQLPIISMLRVQCSVIPTSIYSNHTGFSNHFHTDYTKEMKPYMDMWKKIGAEFDGICVGYLGSAGQIEMVSRFIDSFGGEQVSVVVDPVMGDNGKTYRTCTEEMCKHMMELVKKADIVTPNVTESCILTGTPYKERWTTRELLAMAQKISAAGPGKVVITGIPQKTYVSNLCYEDGVGYEMIRIHRVGCSRHGTGDIFAAIIAADALNRVKFTDSVRKASRFIKKCIEKSLELEIPTESGVCFEELLGKLR